MPKMHVTVQMDRELADRFNGRISGAFDYLTTAPEKAVIGSDVTISLEVEVYDQIPVKPEWPDRLKGETRT